MNVSSDQERSVARRLKSFYESCVSSLRYIFRRGIMARQIGLEDSRESNAILLKYISVISAERRLSVLDIIPYTTFGMASQHRLVITWRLNNKIMADNISNDSSFSAASRNPHSEHELLLYELETSDTSSVGLVVRAIYEGDEYEKFMERLDARIKNHDRDIERMCNFHYQGFIDSIRELLQVRTKAQKLKSEVQLTNDDLQQSAKKVMQKAEELVKHRRIQYNISCAINNLNLCQPVLEMYFKLLHQMKEKKVLSST
ncbi:exocyst complex component 6B [Caerostris extrusa]|uniref:Exocyst complex component 6B n=1 Tax=Caerostris extrusa TaxID=172846 RepID=A0AAV4W4H4_CAEEX|nr:exocyst complex component 6B [Caerostris extrusa]